jgi:hypothetical protein
MTHKILGLLVAGLLLGAPASASAAPATVDLRVEGHTTTLYEGKVTTDVGPFAFTAGADQSEHACDGTGSSGATTTPSPTRGAALTVAARTAPFAMAGSWGTYGASIASIAGENVQYDSATSSYLVEYKNGVAASYGACGDPIQNGDDVVFAWGSGSDPVLKLVAPATVAPGADARLTVTQEGSGAPVAGAAVGGQTSAADGTAHVSFTDRGPHVLKATKNGTIRSNTATVCVTDGSDGYCGSTAPGAAPAPATPAPCTTTGDDGLCGSPDHRAPLGAFAASLGEGKHFAKGKGPRELTGHVASDPSGIADIRLRVTGNDHGRCTTYDATKELLTRLKRCGAGRGSWFSVGTSQDFRYLLPARLGGGRWVLDLQVVDKAGNRTTPARGTSRVVFTVA